MNNTLDNEQGNLRLSYLTRTLTKILNTHPYIEGVSTNELDADPADHVTITITSDYGVRKIRHLTSKEITRLKLPPNKPYWTTGSVSELEDDLILPSLAE